VNVELFAAQIPHYALRTLVRPGVTGWAQVRFGYANNLAEETEKMRYDLHYIKHMSLWLDFRIIVDTLGTIIGGASVEPAAVASERLPVRAVTSIPSSSA
jgi:lipopolysaccharide/colanic/teichoic acid biosynthesis glycosyltransferase